MGRRREAVGSDACGGLSFERAARGEMKQGQSALMDLGDARLPLFYFWGVTGGVNGLESVQ